MIPPHGGVLVDRQVPFDKREETVHDAAKLQQIEVDSDLARDVENIAFGAFSPLEGFLCEDDYQSVLQTKRLRSDMVWTIPILLDGSRAELKGVKEGDTVALVDATRLPFALLDVEEIYNYSKKELAEHVYGTTDSSHPGVVRTFAMKDSLVGGKIRLIDPLFDEFQRFRLKPIETRVLFKEKGWRTIVGFQTRNIPHLGHEYVQKTALTFVDGLFINPVIGKKKSGDFKDEVILDAYATLLKHYYLKDRTIMAILRTEMRYAGPREAIFHAIVRKNFGCTHFVVGRDHAGVGKYYSPYAAQDIFSEFPDLGIVPLFFKEFSYCKKCQSVVNEKICPHDPSDHIDFSGTKLRERLSAGEAPPKELVRAEVAEVLLKWKEPFVR
ncbi:MAG: sulfate adenylyltransferase [Candidatus Bathyarchaeia archaeon]